MLTAKFLRAHTMPTNPNPWLWLKRLMWEFWGFCVNGDNGLANPGFGAFAAVSGTQLPVNLTTAGLLDSGSDGFTAVGEPFFNTVSQNISSSYVGKWVVMWQSGSNSTDDSIYQITQWFNSGSVRLNVFTGGTPYTGSLHPSLTTRNNINYRIVDFAAAAAVGGSLNSDYMILQFNDAGTVNPGQASSQLKVRFALDYNGSDPIIGLTMSPSGSWGLHSGSYGFTDPTSELEHSSNGGGWGSLQSAGSGYISFWAASDFFIMHLATTQNFHSNGFHVEIPQRLYPQVDDPNPIMMMEWGQDTPSQTDSSQMYAGGLYMHNPPDRSTMLYYGMGRRFFANDQNAVGGQTNGRLNGAFFNTYQNNFLFTDAVLCNPQTPGQYQLARARMRRARFIAPIIPQFQRIGNNGEWLHVINGIMWPWDNTLLSYNLFLGGT